jgi:hypothetical protein
LRGILEKEPEYQEEYQPNNKSGHVYGRNLDGTNMQGESLRQKIRIIVKISPEREQQQALKHVGKPSMKVLTSVSRNATGIGRCAQEARARKIKAPIASS